MRRGARLLRRSSALLLLMSLLFFAVVITWQQVRLDQVQAKLDQRVTRNGDSLTFQGKTLRELQNESERNAQRLLDSIYGAIGALQAEINELRAEMAQAPVPPPQEPQLVPSPRPTTVPQPQDSGPLAPTPPPHGGGGGGGGDHGKGKGVSLPLPAVPDTCLPLVLVCQ